MTPDLAGRLETRLVVFLLAVLPLTAALATVLDLGGAPGTAALIVLYWLPLGLVAEPLYALAQRLRREGDWPALHVAYGLALEGAIVVALLHADRLPGVPACLRTTQDLALRRWVCAEPSLTDAEAVTLIGLVIAVTLAMLGLVLPILLPRWPFDGWRLWRHAGRR